MGLNKYKLGELIELCDTRNSQGGFTESDVRGISNTKELMLTKADLLNRSLDDFKIVFPNEFVFNRRTTRMGEKFAITLNNSGKAVIVTNDYIVFKVIKEAKLLNEYLFMYFNRPEFDRYVRFNSWGSATEMFVWENMCNVNIYLPSIEQQRKYVNIYLSFQKNLDAYQSNVEDLKTVCDGYIEELRRNIPSKKIGPYIKRYSEKNVDKTIDSVVGLSTQKQFRVAQSRVNREELGGYKIVHPNDIAYVPTTDTWKVLAFAVNHFEKDVVVSPIYEVFSVMKGLNPDYLAMWLKRKEFDRYARLHSWGSARENFTFEEMQEVQIPIPDENTQQSIVNIYLAHEERQRIAAQLKEQLKNLCPILIKGSLQTDN